MYVPTLQLWAQSEQSTKSFKGSSGGRADYPELHILWRLFGPKLLFFSSKKLLSCQRHICYFQMSVCPVILSFIGKTEEKYGGFKWSYIWITTKPLWHFGFKIFFDISLIMTTNMCHSPLNGEVALSIRNVLDCFRGIWNRISKITRTGHVVNMYWILTGQYSTLSKRMELKFSGKVCYYLQYLQEICQLQKPIQIGGSTSDSVPFF